MYTASNGKQWRVSYSGNRPATGLWKAVRHGVEFGSGTKEGLIRIIEGLVKSGRWCAIY